MQFCSVSDLQLFQECLRKLGCNLYERKASDNATSPNFQIQSGSGTSKQISSKSATAIATPQKVPKKPTRQRTISTRKKSQTPSLPALQLAPPSHSSYLATANTFSNVNSSTKSQTIVSSSSVPQKRSQSSNLDQGQAISLSGETMTLISTETSAHAQIDRANIDRPFRTSISSYDVEHERSDLPSWSSHTAQHERSEYLGSEVMHGSRSPATRTDSYDVPTRIPTQVTGNAAYLERLAQNSEVLPPRRHLPFLRSPASSEISRAATSPVSNSTMKQARNDLSSSQGNQSPEKARETQVLSDTANGTDQGFASPLGTAYPRAETGPLVTQPSDSFMQQVSRGPQSLKGYTALSDDQRFEIVEAGVVACLKDDNFVQFCEDLYNTWPRIGLDLEMQDNPHA
jgi:hypothetical protein